MTSLRDTNLTYKDGEHPVHGTWLSVDVVAFTYSRPKSKIILITRDNAPHKGETTLPGSLLAAWNGETVEQAAKRIIREKVGTDIIGDISLITVVSDPSRDERGHTVSIVVAARVADLPQGIEAENVPADMPFGHSEMVNTARKVLARDLLVKDDLTYAMLGDTTTLPDTFALMSACDPNSAETTVRSRLARTELYTRLRGAALGRGGRPPIVYRRADVR